MFLNELEVIWHNILVEAKLLINTEPDLISFIDSNILKYKNFKSALINIISRKLFNIDIGLLDLKGIFEEICRSDNNIVISAARDICAVRLRDPSVNKYITPFLYFKGFHALQSYRFANWLWYENRRELAMYLYGNIVSVFNVDIHPAAKIGCGIVLDHATGVVIGETSVIEDDVCIMQSVTLGGTGKVIGDRHPKIRKNVIIGAGAIVLGNIEIGLGAKIGAGSVVLHSVPSNATVIGKPARLIDRKINTK